MLDLIWLIPALPLLGFVLIFLFYLFTLLVRILFDLLHCLLVVIHHLLDFSLELLDLVFLDLDEVIVVLLLLVNPGCVFLEQVSLRALV